MIRRPIAAAVAAAALLALTTTASMAAILAVDDDRAEAPSAPFTTIAAATAVAGDGDTIAVYPGTYQEQVVLSHNVILRGISFGAFGVVIQPLALPQTRPSVLVNLPVAAGILADSPFVSVENITLDMTSNGVAGCSPLLVGVYMRNASGAVKDMQIDGVRPGTATCDSGIGLYIESGKAGEHFGESFFGRSNVDVRDNTYTNYQKAAVVMNGRYTNVTLFGDTALGGGPTGNAVQYGFQVGASAKARLSEIIARDHISSLADKTAAGVLAFGAKRVQVRRAEITNGEAGVFVVGSGVKVIGSDIGVTPTDAVALLGDRNVLIGNTLHQADVSGVFIVGLRNRVRGGFMSDMPVGVWIHQGLLNRFGGITFEDVPTATQGIYGGSRDLQPSAVSPVAACRLDAECDDGNACTYDLCDTPRALCTHPAVPNGTVCGIGQCVGGVCN
jgi:hypothetical protein